MTQALPPEHAAPWYRREAWLTVCLASFVLVTIAIAVPSAWKTRLIGLAGVLMLVSVVMLMRHHRQGRVLETREHVPSDLTIPAD